MTKRGRALLLLGPLFLMGASRPAPVSGLFGDVRESKETGDFSGIELEIFADGPKPHVDFVLCEGECLSVHRMPARIAGNRVMFEYIEQPVFSDGLPAPATHTDIVATVTSRGVSLRSTGYVDFRSDNLPRLDRRYGLAIASANNR